MKLYKNTFYVCLIFAFVSMLVAVIIQFFNPLGFLLLIQNFCIGLSCSSILVIVPTFLQYHDLKTRELKDLGNLLYYISMNIVIGSWEDLSEKQYRMIGEQLRDQFQELMQFQINYSTIIPSEREKIAKKVAPIIKYGIDFALKMSKYSYVTAVRNLSNTEKGKEIVAITLQIAENIPCIDILEDYIKEFESDD